MPAAGRRPDQLALHAAAAERVRKLEVMPNPATIPAAQWRPGYDDLYAIAGHVYLLGCYQDPDHTSTIDQLAHPGQAAQYLWAQLDQRGFANNAEGQDWTIFLYRLAALPRWTRYRNTLQFTAGAPSASEAAEAHSALPFHAPRLRTCWAADQPFPGQPQYTRFISRALYWAGIPDHGSYTIVKPDGFSPSAPVASAGGYELWDGTSAQEELWFENPIRPVQAQDNYWQHAAGPAFGTGPCDAVEPRYNGSEFPGFPWGPFPTGAVPCPNSSGLDVSLQNYAGNVYRYRMVFDPFDVFLTCPPRIMRQDIVGSDYWHPVIINEGGIFEHGPGLDWLAEGVDAILDEHPHVAAFYAQHLPIAYAAKYQVPHSNLQQLELSVGVRGRLEAHKKPDRVILRGRISSYATRPPSDLFRWPDDWPEPAPTSTPFAAVLTAYREGHGPAVCTFNRSTRMFQINFNPYGDAMDGWILDGGYILRFDGITVPINMTP